MKNNIESRLLRYEGTKQPPRGYRDDRGREVYPYLPDQELIEAVNLAIQLERPLLLKGEPGCGKTRLAHHVAFELSLDYEVWPVQSTTRARDGRYIYDNVARLRDAQLAATEYTRTGTTQYVKPDDEYIIWGPLGKAFQSERGVVLLIDEIDKADIDFPNDLLMELDEKFFRVEEARIEVNAQQNPPIVLITSNDERDLPEPFLRRCVFYFLEFPKPDRLVQILKAHYPSAPQEIVMAVIERFLNLRDEMIIGNAKKLVSTSELLDWLQAIIDNEVAVEKLSEELLYPGVLLKTWHDYNRFAKRKPKEARP